jgi:hypothetical protein
MKDLISITIKDNDKRFEQKEIDRIGIFEISEL